MFLSFSFIQERPQAGGNSVPTSDTTQETTSTPKETSDDKRRPQSTLPGGRLDHMAQFLIHLPDLESMAMTRMMLCSSNQSLVWQFLFELRSTCASLETPRKQGSLDGQV